MTDLPEPKVLKHLWYAGLGEKYRLSRGQLGTAGCHDKPGHRLIFYYSAAASNVVMSTAALGFAFSGLSNELLQMEINAGLTAVIVFFCVFSLRYSYLTFQSAQRLRQAQTSHLDPDEHDPLRLRAMRKAFAWGLKRRFVQQDSNGNWSFETKR